MKAVKQIFLGLGLLVVLGVVIGIMAGDRLRGGVKETLSEAKETPPEKGVLRVTVAPVTLRTVQRTVEAVGSLRGYEEVSIASKVEGRVRRVLKDSAERVVPGEMLVELDPTEADLNVRQAERALQVELAKLGLKQIPPDSFDIRTLPGVQQAAIRLENAQARLDRVLKGGTAVSSEEAAEKKILLRLAQAEYEEQVLNAQSSLATLRLRQEALSIAQQQRRECNILAPLPERPIPGLSGDAKGIEYVMIQRDVAEGSFVRVGTEIGKLVVDSVLKLKASVPERFGAEVKVGQEVQVFHSAYSKPFQATVRKVGAWVDPSTRTFEVEIEVPNKDARLRAGGFAKGIIQTYEEKDTVTVPLEALVTFAGVNKIFTLENGQAKEHKVTIGSQTTQWVEITTPKLTGKEIVITSSTANMVNGQKVEIRAEPKEQDATKQETSKVAASKEQPAKTLPAQTGKEQR